jgi:DNA-binding LacI/PurR family transcriptional regulator
VDRIKKLKSIDDIARLAGVSKSTVSRALNDSPLVGEETKARIVAIAKDHEFKPSAIARNLSTRKSRTIAFVNCAFLKYEGGLSDLFSIEIMGGIGLGLYELGYDMLIASINPGDRDWVPGYLDSGKVDGFILMTSESKKEHVDLLLESGAPFIAWGFGAGRYCSVSGDDARGGRLAAERFLSRGRRRIGFIGGPRVETEVKERYRGFSEALRDAGLDPKQLAAFCDYSEHAAEREMAALLRRPGGVDAVFVAGDLMAIAAMRSIKAAGLRIPDDVAVIGYDDLTIASYVTPSLTTVNQNVPGAGRILARDLVAFLEKGVVSTTTVPVRLVERESA